MQLTTAGGRGETHSQACSQPAPLTHYYYYNYYYYYNIQLSLSLIEDIQLSREKKLALQEQSQLYPEKDS